MFLACLQEESEGCIEGVYTTLFTRTKVRPRRCP